MVDRTKDFVEILNHNHGYDCSKNLTRPPSLFLIKSFVTWQQIASFERLLLNSFDGYIGYHRFLPPTSVVGQLTNFSQADRKHLTEEVVSFLSLTAKCIQQLNCHIDANMQSAFPAQNTFYQNIVSALVQKLQRFSKYWDHMQNSQKKIDSPPSKLFAYYYSDRSASMIAENQRSDSNEKFNSKQAEFLKPIPSKLINPPDQSFAQRFVDDIAPPLKMREYERVATEQKDLLMKESQSLQRKFSHDMQQSHQIESTVMSLSSMVAEFANLIDSQSELVEGVGDAAKDTTQSVKLADQELLMTIERSHSYQWSMILLIFGASLLLLFLHIITP